MILTKLKEYAETQMMLPPSMYGESFIKWIVNIDLEGNLIGFITLGDSKKGLPMMTPKVPPVGNGIKPRLLVETGERVFGIPKGSPKPSDPKRVKNYHQSFKDMIKCCADSTKNESVEAVWRFLQKWNPELDFSKLPSELQLTHIVTFQCNGIIPADARARLIEVEQFWGENALLSSQTSKSENPTSMTCLVTGRFATVCQRMPVPIKEIIGKKAEYALVSANSEPYTSYGLKNSLTSPISRDAAEKFAKALNHLIASPNSKINIGTTTYVAWTREPSEDVAETLEFLDKPDPQAVINLLDSAEKGKQTYGEKPNQFYVLALTANSSRAVIRDWLEMTIPEVKANLRAWFTAQKIIDSYGEEGKPLSVYRLAASAYRDPAKEMLPAVTTSLTRVALYGGKVSLDLLARLVRRNHVEQDVTYSRAASIKLILTTQNEQFGMLPMENLNPDPELQPKEPAYHCGRLLAELEATQRAALGKINATLTDRYYGAASSNPASAFPPLMRGARAHLSKLRKNQAGTCNALEERIEEITSHLITGFPKTLTMQNQGLFALGYYHQRAANRAAAKSAIASKLIQESN